jgi:hypothetical protein
LWSRGFIVKYRVDDREFGHIPSWRGHQFINNREKPSEFPEPNKTNELTCASRVADATVTEIRPRKEEGKGREGERKDDDERGACLISDEAFRLSAEVLKAEGRDKDDPRCMGYPYSLQNWITKGWKPEIILTTIKVVVANKQGPPPKSLNYYEMPIAEAHARAHRPLPIAAPSREKPYGRNVQANGALLAATDAIIESLRGGSGQEDVRDGEDPPPLRTISKG